MKQKLRLVFLLACLSLPAVAQFTQSGTISTANAACNLPTTSCVDMVLSPTGPQGGTTILVITITGSFTGTIQFEASGDNKTTWASIFGLPSGGGAAVTSATAAGVWVLQVAGFTNFRARASALSAGTPVVVLQAATGINQSGLSSFTTVNANNYLLGGVALNSTHLSDSSNLVRYNLSGTFSQAQNLGTSWLGNGSVSGTTTFLMPGAAGTFNFKIPILTADDTPAMLGLANVFTAVQQYPNGSAAAPPMTFANSATAGFYSGGSAALCWATGGVVKGCNTGAAGYESIQANGFSWAAAPPAAFDTALGRAGAGIITADTTAFGNGLGTFKAAGYSTTTNCAAVGSAASPSVASCTAAPAGAFSCATNAVSACTVNTTAVTANSEIIVQQTANTGVGTRLSVTCNTATSATKPLVTAQVNGTSFTIQLSQPVTNPDCFYYQIIN